MAVNKKGLRSITVKEQIYFWRFDEKIYVFEEEKKCQLIIDFGWYDEWLFVNDPENRPPDFQPKNVTPKFVSRAISCAINEGWREEKMEIEYRDGCFQKKN